jgi:transcriptional regulator with XRE-family HTH domain
MPRRTPRAQGADELAPRRIRYERERRGWSTAELARQVTDAGAPIRQQAIWEIENRHPPRRISLGEAIAIAKVFDLDILDLTDPPDSVLTARMRSLIEDFDALEDEARALVLRTLRVAQQLEKVNQEADPLLAYMGWTDARMRTSGIRKHLTTTADLLIRIRDELARLSPGEDEQADTGGDP